MKQLNTTGIVLSRTNFGEADRIVTMLTPDHGKLRLVVRGARKIKSKMAGGVELFSVSDITFIRGKSELSTLVSCRLQRHYEHIVQDINRVQAGYEIIKTLNKHTEDEPEPAYFDLLNLTLQALDDESVPLDLVKNWYDAQLLKLAGYMPNLETDTDGTKLESDQKYSFNFDAMAFKAAASGSFNADKIKFLRLLFSDNSPLKISHINGAEALTNNLTPIMRTMAQSYLHV